MNKMTETKNSNSKKKNLSKLKQKLRDRITGQKLCRTSRVVRENEKERIKKELRKKPDKNQRKNLKKRKKMLEKADEYDEENFEKTMNGDFVTQD